MTEKLSSHKIIFHKGSLQDGEWHGEGVKCLSVFVNSKVGRDEFEKLPDLKYITTRSTGRDHIDIEEASKRGVHVESVPTYGENTVAEFVFALLLMLSRKMFSAHEKVTVEGSFSSDGLTGFDLFGKRFGVLGTGSIGKNVIRIAKGFGMEVIAFDKERDEKFAGEAGFTYSPSLEELLGVSDIVSLHIPETAETRHIIDKNMVEKMKKGIIIINTARGALIETDALVYGLKEGIVSAAGLDVLDEEGYVDDEMRLLEQEHPKSEELRTLLLNHYLIDHPNVVITPHNAFNTTEALQRILDETIANIATFERNDNHSEDRK